MLTNMRCSAAELGGRSPLTNRITGCEPQSQRTGRLCLFAHLLRQSLLGLPDGRVAANVRRVGSYNGGPRFADSIQPWEIFWMSSLTRRVALKLLGIGAALCGSQKRSPAQGQPNQQASDSTVSWRNTHDRVWLDADCWANPMEDWRIVDGAAECQSAGGDRNVHLITHQLTNPKGGLEMSVVVAQVEANKQDGGAGFRIGVNSEINDYRSNTFAKSGINAGLRDGQLILARKTAPLPAAANPQNVTLRLTGKPSGEKYDLTLTASQADGAELGRVSASVPAAAVLGNVCIVNSFDPKTKAGARYRLQTGPSPATR